ncbi:MAG: DUF6782 family putative metallopeptidase [Terriglobia bacterium]|jgi:hypothetical protein
MNSACKTSPRRRPRLKLPAVLTSLLLAYAASTAWVLTAAQSPQDLLSQADSVLQQMSELTGLAIKSSLKKQVISRPEVSKYISETLRSEMTPQEIHIQEATLQAFGLVAPDFNLEKFLISFYTEQAAGFYDPLRKTMFIADWVEPDMQRMVLSHELTHALQDQSYDLEKFLKADRDDDDASAAREAVVEGHATAAMIQEMIEPMKLEVMPSLEPLMAPIIQQQLEEFPAFTKAPFFFRFQALFPYIEGIGFMQHGLQAGGWKRLSSLFDNPPRTTKEIFQPEVYFDKQPLPKVTLPQPAALAGVHGVSFLAENIMGEMGYYALLGQLISEDEAKSVAPNWLADRYLLYEKSDAGPGKKQYVLVSQTRWSSAESAQAFFRDYHTILAHKYPELAPDPRSTSDLFIGKANNGQVVMLRKDADCLWAEGIPATQAEAILNWLKSR